MATIGPRPLKKSQRFVQSMSVQFRFRLTTRKSTRLGPPAYTKSCSAKSVTWRRGNRRWTRPPQPERRIPQRRRYPCPAIREGCASSVTRRLPGVRTICRRSIWKVTRMGDNALLATIHIRPCFHPRASPSRSQAVRAPAVLRTLPPERICPQRARPAMVRLASARSLRFRTLRAKSSRI